MFCVSPTGVTYYEFYAWVFYTIEKQWVHCFRPQQGLTIMNGKLIYPSETRLSFRPQQGLTIMNSHDKLLEEYESRDCFRPQQGLTIMNTTLLKHGWEKI